MADKRPDTGSSRTRLYKLAQWTWGLPQTLIGAGLFLAHRKDRHFDYHGAKVTLWDKPTGISLGRFIFVPSRNGRPDEFILDHEYGHTIQSLMLGPAYLLLVGAPSILWHRLPAFEHMRNHTGKSYYSVLFEKSANSLGAKATGRKRK
ncbi:MAG: hypothetical protein IJH90_03995 [Mogibacterium sp.]|nr:hypothetical protein [Mogibacterium sp.]